MSDPDNKPVGFFFGPGAEWEPAPTAGQDDAVSQATPASAEPEAWTAPVTSTEPAPTAGPDNAVSQATPASAEPEAWTAPSTSTEPGASTVPAVPVEAAQSPTVAAPGLPAARTVAAEPPPQPSPPAPAPGPGPAASSGAITEATGEGAENYFVTNADGSTTTQLPDGSFQTVVRLPGGATIVTSTSPPGSSPSAAAADPPRDRRWRRRDR